MVRSAPLKFSGDNWNAAKCGGDLVANGGALNLLEAHVHDSDNACGERSGDDESEVSEVDCFAVSKVVCSCVFVGDSAIVHFVELGG